LDITKSWWKLGSEMENEMFRTRSRELPPGEIATDVSCTSMLICILLGVLGLAFITPIWILLVLYKFIPGTLILYKELFKEYFRNSEKFWKACCCPCFVVVVFLVPIPAIFFMIGCLLHGIVVGASPAVVYLEQQSIVSALTYIPHVLREYDLGTNKIIGEELHVCNRGGYGQGYSCFEWCCREASDPEIQSWARSASIFH